MNTRDIMFALQCCSPNAKSERDCSICPFNGSETCHTDLCETVIDYIMREQSKTERFARGVDTVVDAVNHLHSLY